MALEVDFPALFDCTRLSARVTKAGCARLFRSANSPETAPKPWESRIGCVGCAIGAGNAGADLEGALRQARAAELAGGCVRCGAGAGSRIVGGLHCVSCYNRLREALRGRDARGRSPRHAAALHVVSLVVAPARGLDGAERVLRDVTSRAEAALIVARRAAGAAVLIGMRRIAPLPLHAQAELPFPVVRRARPGRRLAPAPACAVTQPLLALEDAA